MSLSSRHFRGDPALEAAATNDTAHITQGARGQHVAKIQGALNILDDAGLGEDGIYGAGTAKAVLTYKTKRNIVNRNYQSAADNIVGKMTIASLDEEMLAYEREPVGKIEIIPISPKRAREKAYPRFNLAPSKAKTFSLVKSFAVLPEDMVEIDIGDEAEIVVKNGRGYHLRLESSRFDLKANAKIYDRKSKEWVTMLELDTNYEKFRIKGLDWGGAILIAYVSTFWEDETKVEKLIINVRDGRPTAFHPTHAHHHEPVSEPDEWNKVLDEALKDPDLGWTLRKLAERRASPETIAGAATFALARYPTAGWHLNYYVNGGGGVVNEDVVLKKWIEGDSHARDVIARRIKEARRASESPVHVMFEYNQLMFGDDDARQSFGTIDNLEVSADFITGKVEIWFEDTYEWHPTYSQYTKPLKCPDVDVKRETILGHAAFVQMKKRGAKDFQMRGEATFPMKIFPGL